jgi:hypothetical protein
MPQAPHHLVQIHKSEAGCLHYTLLLTLRSQYSTLRKSPDQRSLVCDLLVLHCAD